MAPFDTLSLTHLEVRKSRLINLVNKNQIIDDASGHPGFFSYELKQGMLKHINIQHIFFLFWYWTIKFHAMKEEVEVNFLLKRSLPRIFLQKCLNCIQWGTIPYVGIHIITIYEKIAQSDIVDSYHSAFEIYYMKFLQRWRMQPRSLTSVCF